MVRSCAGARSPSRLQMPASSLSSGLRTIFAAALLAERIRCEDALFLLDQGPTLLASEWNWEPSKISVLLSFLHHVVRQPTSPLQGEIPWHSTLPVVDIPTRTHTVAFALCAVYFCTAIAAGWQWNVALRAFAHMKKALTFRILLSDNWTLLAATLLFTFF